MLLANKVKAQRDRDRQMLTGLEGREAEIADAAPRMAYEKMGDWLTSKQCKAEQFPGGDLVRAKGRAAAYQNAAQEVYGWAISHRED